MDSKNSAAGYAEYAVASEGFVMKIPDSLSFESAAAIPEVGAQDRKIALRGLLSRARALLQLPLPPCADAELRSAPSCLMQCPTLLLTECAWCRPLGLVRLSLKRLTLLLPTCLQTFITCYLEIVILGQLREGQSVLIHGAAGGIGAPALWLSTLWGALTVGASPSTCCTLPPHQGIALHCAAPCLFCTGLRCTVLAWALYSQLRVQGSLWHGRPHRLQLRLKLASSGQAEPLLPCGLSRLQPVPLSAACPLVKPCSWPPQAQQPSRSPKSSVPRSSSPPAALTNWPSARNLGLMS